MKALPLFAEMDAAIAREPAKLCAGAGLILCIVAFWMLEHPYEGIVHDSILYAFSALARLHPESLGHDVYLSLGVQDRYTVFSPLAASVMRPLGLERGAMLITLGSQLAFFGCGWLMARRLMPATEAALSVALLVSLPAIYGDSHIFSYAEAFMTARLPAEALVLGALAAATCGRAVLAAACLIAAALLHPIMASAGLVFLFVRYFALRRPLIAGAMAAIGLATLALIARLAPFGPVARFDTGWFDLLYFRGMYLFPSQWPLADWAHVSVPLTTLGIGAIASSQPRIRSTCIAALVLGAAGLAASLAGADLLRIELVAQAQPWRWLWLSNALAVVLMPVVFKSCWSAGGARRASAILLAAAWVSIDETYAPVIDLFAVVAASTARYATDARRARLMLIGAWLTLGLSLLVLAGYVLHVMREVALITPDRGLYDSPYLLELRRWKSWQAGGILPACILLAAWRIATYGRRLSSAVAVLILGVGLCAAFAHFAWNAWTRADLAGLYEDFAPWRRVIPERAEVYWSDDAYPTWFLLERPSYWSRTQMSASVFSEPLARELARREWVILAVRNSTHDPRELLVRTCRNNPGLQFYVSAADAGRTPFPSIADPKGADSLWLYRCADVRGQGDP